MNKERIQGIIDHIKDNPDFDMSKYWDQCGAPACIAGWAVYLYGVKYSENYYTTHEQAVTLLDISQEVGKQLFDPEDFFREFYNREISNVQAVETLENFLKTGKVIWNV